MTIEGDAEILVPEFGRCLANHARVERIWTGGRWLEGPAWFGGGRYLIWSDIPNNRLMRWDEPSGAVTVFREPSDNANGNTVDRQGRLVTCEHLTRRVTRTEHDGTRTVLADRIDGKRLNSPNDVVVHPRDGGIWFTDPTYGIISDYEGRCAEPELGGSCVYRIDAHSGEVRRMIADFMQPNGIAFSPSGATLYVSDTGGSHDEQGPRHIRRFEIDSDNAVSGGEVFAECSNGLFDGFRIDRSERLWCSAGDGVHCYEPSGTLIGKILVPETVANLAFGGARRNRLFICATTSLYSVFVDTAGTGFG